ncbi:cystatin-A-like [Ostrea edulis]|uniref:cystatin-A-like n=1 Tax=Ostrea edulis TaxID=37623 RepID=UPI0024AFB372|nr:cystatin-A-like [Ostrea edulis]
MKNSAVFALSVVCACIVAGNAANRPIVVGGLGRTKYATPEIQALVNSVRRDIIMQLPIGYNREVYLPLKARFYREQVVAGRKYFIKIQTGPMRFIHVRIYKDLRGGTSVSGVQLQKSIRDPIEYF